MDGTIIPIFFTGVRIVFNNIIFRIVIFQKIIRYPCKVVYSAELLSHEYSSILDRKSERTYLYHLLVMPKIVSSFLYQRPLLRLLSGQ